MATDMPARAVDYPELHLIVGGERCGTGGTLPVIDPATGETLGLLPMATASDLGDAVAAADAALPAWAATSPWERGRVLQRAAGLLRTAIPTLAPVLVLENGKTLAEANGELQATADTLEWFGEEAKRPYGRTLPARNPEGRFLVFREPVGVAALFSPWNFPAINLVRKLAPALAAGCTVVAKPPEETPATPLALAQALIDAGLPPGVLNIVYGMPAEISARLIADPAVRKVSFTGSTAVGRQLARLAADGLKRMTMELGGHAPVIVCADADPERAATMAAAAKFRNAGQTCNSASRFYVHRSIHDRFAARFAECARAVKVGCGLDPATTMGPLSNARRLDAMLGLVEDALAKGARLAAGGERIGARGFFFQPTVLTKVPADARILREEPFGPIAPIVAFDELDEAIRLANALPLGLAGYAITDHAPSARRIARELQTGVVAINNFVAALPETPFGGVRDSGWGSEGGTEGMDAYLRTKFVNEA